MPFSAGDSIGGGEQINHFGGITLRVSGAGVLRPKFYGLDGNLTYNLPTYTMGATPGRAPFVLANFVNQRARLELKTTAINERFKVNRIIIHVKPIFTSFPG